MNKLLVSPDGETLSLMILQDLPEDHRLYKFENFRAKMFRLNNHLVKDTETKMPDLHGLGALKKKLRSLNF